MIKKTVKITTFSGNNETAQNLEYWLSRSPTERIAAVEFLRGQNDADKQGIQRVVSIRSFAEIAALESVGEI